jgi:hypothetical protein
VGPRELTVTTSPRPIRPDADPTRLAQVLELLNNAAKYMTTAVASGSARRSRAATS